MSLFSRKKKHSKAPSTSVPASGLASSQVAQQERQQSQPVGPWSAHAPPFRQSLSPFLRNSHALSASATAAGELFLFGGYVRSSKSPSNDLYVISTRDFSANLLKTTGDVPSPRYGHSAVLSSTILLIWGGVKSFNDQIKQNQALDDLLYLLNLGMSDLLITSSIPVSREWTRIVVNGPGPGGRYGHTITLVGSKHFVFGGRTAKERFNDIWALDLDCLNSNPFWESYEPAPGNEKPLPRAGHVSVTTGDRIIIFGGYADPHTRFNDTWSFNISTRKWTELQCTGSIPSPRANHAAVLIDDVMYVFGGRAIDGTFLGDLTALNLSTQRWIAFQDIGPSSSGRSRHAMACDGTRVFVIGGKLSPGAEVDEAKLIHVLETIFEIESELLIYPKPDSNTVKHSEKTTQPVQKLSAGHPTQDQPQHGIFSSSDTGAAHSAFPFKIATSEDMGQPASPQITRERNPSSNGLPSRPTGASGRPSRVPEEGDDGEGSTEHHAKLVVPDAPSGKELARLEDGRLVELERQLSETLVVKTERDRRISQLTDELALKSALLEQAAEEKKRAGLEVRKLQAKLDELLLSRDHALEQAEANGEEKKRAGLELRELQAKLDELLLSRDRALEQAQSALQKASCAAESNEQNQRELTEMRAELEASKSESATFRLRLADAENGCANSKADADTYRTQTATGLVNTDEDRVVHRLMERMQAMEAEMASLRGNEKSFEMMECRNEG
ncbi:hypothetical protein F5888DRAFT_1633488 [Russula emetica]|nr:hypothetical protein F5888DRAFT_1633488 [Russula emetica]